MSAREVARAAGERPAGALKEPNALRELRVVECGVAVASEETEWRVSAHGCELVPQSDVGARRLTERRGL